MHKPCAEEKLFVFVRLILHRRAVTGSRQMLLRKEPAPALENDIAVPKKFSTPAWLCTVRKLRSKSDATHEPLRNQRMLSSSQLLNSKSVATQQSAY